MNSRLLPLKNKKIYYSYTELGSRLSHLFFNIQSVLNPGDKTPVWT